VAKSNGQDLARRRFETLPGDANAFFAMTLSLGMEADYAALIEKHPLESLGTQNAVDGVRLRDSHW